MQGHIVLARDNTERVAEIANIMANNS